MNLYEDLQKTKELIPGLLDTYEAFILAGVDFQKLCNEDDFKDYLYTKQDFEDKKPVSELFLAAINTPETFRKETEDFIKEVIRNSGLEQTDPKITEGFKKVLNSWKLFLAELKKIPNEDKPELIKYLQTIDKQDVLEQDADLNSVQESKQILYIIKDSKGNQLSAPSPDDEELWDRVASMEARGRKGLSVVVYTTPKKEALDLAEEFKLYESLWN